MADQFGERRRALRRAYDRLHIKELVQARHDKNRQLLKARSASKKV